MNHFSSPRQPAARCGSPAWLCHAALVVLLNAAASGSAANVVAWGAGTVVNPNNYNQAGQSLVPTGLTNATQLAGGWRHSLAVRNDGTLLGWGEDTLGQTDFPSTSNYLAVACGDLFSLALRTNGTVAATGDDNFYGELDVPAGLSNAVAVAGGAYHGLALKADGTVTAWGGEGAYNYGQAAVPAGLSNVVAVAGGGWHSLVLKADGTLRAWGRGDSGQTNLPPGLSNVVAIAAGVAHNLALKSDGTVAAWGLDTYGEADVPPGLSNVVQIAAGGWHSLALRRDGTVAAWGAGSGANTNVDFGQSTVPPGLSNVVRIAAGRLHSLALQGSAPPVTQVPVTVDGFTAAGFNVSLPTQNGRVYQLEYQDSLTDVTWHALPLHAGSGGLLTLTDPAPPGSQRFYRVQRW
ncbi:MAG TPA: hypothetical protein VFV96_00145 [Verrucomicrobiae bacterium]|nr:hypothetical protein [Verrucomicrobiae bacterium]